MTKQPRFPWLTLRMRGISLRFDKRVPFVWLGLILATLVVMIINMGVGEYPIAPLEVLKTVLHLPTSNPDYDFVVNTLRLPRMLVAALVGFALGISGAIVQGLTRNPLADPNLMGISAGASLVAVLVIVLIPGVPSSILPFATFGGAVVAALLIYVLAWRGNDSPLRLILIGIGLSAILGAMTSFAITFGDIYDVQRAMIWLTGSVYGRSWDEVWGLVPWLVVFVPLAFILSPNLNVLALGEDVARGLGSRVSWQRGLLLLTAVALAGATVAAAGTLGFVGLMAPHLARRFVGQLSEGLLPTSGLIGGLLVVAADLVGRTIFAPSELPCGLVTAVIGAPFFMYLLYQKRGQ
jgi:iron complex transport system permease protein